MINLAPPNQYLKKKEMQIANLIKLFEVCILELSHYKTKYTVKVTGLWLTDPQMDGPITVYPNRKARSLIKLWSIKMVKWVLSQGLMAG